MSELLVVDLITSLILFHISSYVLIMSLLLSVGSSFKHLLIAFFSVLIFLLIIRFYRIYTSCIAKFFDRHVSNMGNKNVFILLFIFLDFIWIKIFYIDHAIEKVVRTNFNINFFYSIHFTLKKIMRFSFLYNVLYNSNNN